MHYRYIIRTRSLKYYLSSFIFLSYSNVATANNIELDVNFFLFFYFNFMFILVSNILSLIHLGFTITAQFYDDFCFVINVQLFAFYLFGLESTMVLAFLNLFYRAGFITRITIFTLYYWKSSLIFVENYFTIWYDLFANMMLDIT